MLIQTIGRVIRAALVVATMAGCWAVEPARAPARLPSASSNELARAAQSCDEPPVRRRPLEPEGCIDPSAARR